jgi:hypothetical protein
LGVESLKFACFIAELANLSWANKGEVKRPEEQYNVLACSELIKERRITYP